MAVVRQIAAARAALVAASRRPRPTADRGPAAHDLQPRGSCARRDFQAPSGDTIDKGCAASIPLSSTLTIRDRTPLVAAGCSIRTRLHVAPPPAGRHRRYRIAASLRRSAAAAAKQRTPATEQRGGMMRRAALRCAQAGCDGVAHRPPALSLNCKVKVSGSEATAANPDRAGRGASRYRERFPFELRSTSAQSITVPARSRAHGGRSRSPGDAPSGGSCKNARRNRCRRRCRRSSARRHFPAASG